MDPMVFGFAIGSLIMASILLHQRRFAKCTIIEIITMVLIGTCFTLWIIFGAYLTFVASIASEIIIGTYLIIQTFKYPRVKYNLSGYLGFILVSIVSMILTKAWTIEEVGFAFSETILSFIILIPLIKKWNKMKGYTFYE